MKTVSSQLPFAVAMKASRNHPFVKEFKIVKNATSMTQILRKRRRPPLSLGTLRLLLPRVLSPTTTSPLSSGKQ